MSPGKLDRYLRRVGFSGTARPDLETLTRLHRGHLAAIPYENLDVQLGVRVGFDLEAIFEKLVCSKRGGWCYEMNGLFAWALEQIGFRVTRMAGAVLRGRLGDSVIGNHLALCVHLEREYLADVGFGDGLIEPVPIVAGPMRQEFLEFKLGPVDDWWRFYNHPQGGAASFDFQLTPASDEVFVRQCQWLQTAAESGFVQNAVCQRFHENQLSMLRGLLLKVIRCDGVEQRTQQSVDEYRETLARQFDIRLSLPDIERLWQKVNHRHAGWLLRQAAQ